MFRDRSVLVACLCGYAMALGCTEVKATFNCVTDDECLWHGVTGRCEPTGFCSLPDTTCPLGWRYSSYAAGSLKHACVDSSGNAVEDNFARPANGVGSGWGTTSNSHGVTSYAWNIYNVAATGYQIADLSGVSDGRVRSGYERPEAYVDGVTQTGGDSLLEFRFNPGATSARADLALNAALDASSLYALYADQSAQTFKIVTGINNVYTDCPGARIGFTYSTATKYWMRFNANGSSLRGRIWLDDSTEPTAWTVSCTSSLLTSGYPATGIYYNPNTAGQNADVFCYALAAASGTARSCFD